MNISSYDKNTHIFQINGKQQNAIDVIKWCRANLGDRGQRWDFVGGINPQVIIHAEGDASLYHLAVEFFGYKEFEKH